jgi:hypothetical protein
MDEIAQDYRDALGGKQARRLALARLPIKEKVKILIELQTIAAPLLRSRGKRAVVFRSDL